MVISSMNSQNFFPLYNTKRDIIGAGQSIKTDSEVQKWIIVKDKADFKIRWIDNIVVPVYGDLIVAYGEDSQGWDESLGLVVAYLNLYTIDGKLLQSININVNSPFCVATVSHNGDFWVAGSRGYTKHDPFVIRRYTPEGELMWEKMLIGATPRQLLPGTKNLILVVKKPLIKQGHFLPGA